MRLFDILAVLVSLSAAFSYLNHRFLKLPTAIGLMLIALVMSLLLIASGPLGLGLEEDVNAMLRSIDFDETLLHGMLSFLLFAGALHVNLTDLLEQRWVITVLATVGVVAHDLAHRFRCLVDLRALGLDISLAYCLLFGALISPTDPIAVLGILKSGRRAQEPGDQDHRRVAVQRRRRRGGLPGRWRGSRPAAKT